MPRAGSKALIVLVGLIVLFAAALPAVAAKKKGNSASSSLKVLVARTNALPDNAFAPAKHRALEKAAKSARLAAAKRPCRAVKSLSQYRRILLGIKVKRGKKGRRLAARIAALGPISLKASSGLLASKRTKRCGGGTKPSRLANTKMKVLKSDANGMKVRVQLPELQFVAQTGAGKTWTQLVLPNTDAPGDPGKPGIPVASEVIGVPDGAKLIVKSSDVDSYTLDGVNVFPAQPDPVDEITKAPNFNRPPFAAKPFTIDPKAYKAKGLTPAQPADGDLLGKARDLTIGNLVVPAVQYDPKAKKLKVLTSVDVNVVFQGGTHTFSDELVSPWERLQRRLAGSLLNAGAVSSKLDFILRRCGAEMLVITNPATRTSADTFANARRAAGYRVSVVETGAAVGQIGTTAAEIQTYIRARLTAPLCIHPSYVTIVGDDELVPTFPGINGIVSDLQYSMRDDTDELPDVAVGRILGADEAQVAAAVAKIIGYETTAPGGAAFLNHASLAAQFQDTDDVGEVNDGREDRTFVQFAETVRKGLVKRGVTVDRIYEDSPTTEPKKFNDGTDIPASLQKPTFPWDGDGADVTTAWNAGRFMIIHRDHGWSDGWGDPLFTTTEVEGLTNGALLPVLMSINCASARYDDDETSFVQQALVKPDGGAVGVFGDTRNSPSWHNSQIGLGFVDALLPSVLPSEGPATNQRVGDALIHGKLRLAGLAPPGSDGNTRNELYLWHYFGDPSMQMWGGGHAPIVFDPRLFEAVFKAEIGPPKPEPPPYWVQVSLPKELLGQPISLLRDGEVVGKAIAGDGSVAIPASFGDGSVTPGDLQVAVEADGAQPISVPVTGVPKAPTKLEQKCPAGGVPGRPVTVSGTLSGAPAGSTVEVTFTPPSGPPEVVKATTDAKGAWKASVTPTANQPGTWSASSHYAGTADYAESSAGPCSFDVEFELT
ncbi:MAG TPA: C25 family cysteine peptidase [Solirubrobacterales bacterium]|nr:C25 family cysteine peptidase [Solirubrobacterales bacterium]